MSLADLWAVPRRKPKSINKRFKNPLVKVDIKTGKLLINRMPEHWAGRRYGKWNA